MSLVQKRKPHEHTWGSRRIKCYVTTADGEQFIEYSVMQVCRCGATQSPVLTKRVPNPP